MGLFSFGRRISFLSNDEAARIVEKIRESEKRTSGEIRVFIESKCRFVNPIDRAAEVFWSLQMDHTDERNGVLIYVAAKDHQAAIWGDEGIHKAVGSDFWKNEVVNMLDHFRQNEYAKGIELVVSDIGEALSSHFPYKPGTDRNELPDDIVFGH
ncbi:TPM domain-containing protein [Flavihumibacter rivuli]|uniref:TPM domain-containing protein n=1 Tax=Flavihumibacter rivuli TaxID=2838156 RepID=UPI001BDE7869|nr:TPM domain-containing protein [Flavihumibacter rivuli]ULQ56646.1 TPM domain-containing protein [Flavihumibacter rivuli]